MTATEATPTDPTNPTDPTVFEVDELLTDSADNLFASTCAFDTVQAAEADGWAPTVWDAVAEAGFAWIGLPEPAGGSGGTLLDGAEVLRIAGVHAAPIPLAETAMLGGWLLAEAGLELPEGPIGVVPGLAGDTLTARAGDDGSVVLDGRAARVPWAARVDRIAALVDVDGRELAVAINPASVTIEPATNLAGEPRPTIECDRVTIPAERVGEVDLGGGVSAAEVLALRGALSRVMLMAGALDAMSRLTLDYTQQRQQFGRPVARFQAVQQHLVWGAQDAALTAMAAQGAAARASSKGVAAARFEIASARTVADDCAATAARWAHQAHGAMGMTQEYALHHLSRRLWSWRREWATARQWPTEVGTLAEAAGADGLYRLIASQ